MAQSVELALSDAGFVVDHAGDGRQALDKITAAPARYQLLLTDDNMPKLTGIDLVRQLHAMKFAGRIIVVSGMINSEKERIYRELGIRTIIEKPFKIPELIRSIERELGL